MNVKFCRRKSHVDVVEREKMARLHAAESELVDLQARADKAVRTIRERQERNHFAESIRMTMRGGATP